MKLCCIIRSTAIRLPLLLYWIRALSDRPFRSQKRLIGHKHWPGVVEVQAHYCYCYCHMVQDLPEHPVGSQRGSWGTSVIIRITFWGQYDSLTASYCCCYTVAGRSANKCVLQTWTTLARLEQRMHFAALGGVTPAVVQAWHSMELVQCVCECVLLQYKLQRSMGQ